MIALTLAVILTRITAVIFRRGLQIAEPRAAGGPIVPTCSVDRSPERADAVRSHVVARPCCGSASVGTVMVSPLTAAILVALFAAAVTVVVHVRTTAALLRP